MVTSYLSLPLPIFLDFLVSNIQIHWRTAMQYRCYLNNDRLRIHILNKWDGSKKQVIAIEYCKGCERFYLVVSVTSHCTRSVEGQVPVRRDMISKPLRILPAFQWCLEMSSASNIEFMSNQSPNPSPSQSSSQKTPTKPIVLAVVCAERLWHPQIARPACSSTTPHQHCAQVFGPQFTNSPESYCRIGSIQGSEGSKNLSEGRLSS